MRDNSIKIHNINNQQQKKETGLLRRKELECSKGLMI